MQTPLPLAGRPEEKFVNQSINQFSSPTNQLRFTIFQPPSFFRTHSSQSRETRSFLKYMECRRPLSAANTNEGCQLREGGISNFQIFKITRSLAKPSHCSIQGKQHSPKGPDLQPEKPLRPTMPILKPIARSPAPLYSSRQPLSAANADECKQKGVELDCSGGKTAQSTS